MASGEQATLRDDATIARDRSVQHVGEHIDHRLIEPEFTDTRPRLCIDPVPGPPGWRTIPVFTLITHVYRQRTFRSTLDMYTRMVCKRALRVDLSR